MFAVGAGSINFKSLNKIKIEWIKYYLVHNKKNLSLHNYKNVILSRGQEFIEGYFSAPSCVTCYLFWFVSTSCL